MRAAEHALRILDRCGVEYLFGIPGGTVNAFYDALLDVPGLTPVVARHEATAAYMAAAYAKHGGGLGVAIASSGPGSTNLITGVASAMRDGLPLLVLTGQIPAPRMGFGGAQEASPWTMDMVDAFRPFTKRSVLVDRPELVGPSVIQAIRLALTAPRGPVHLSIPVDVQLADVGEPPLPAPPQIWESGGLEAAELAWLAHFLDSSHGVIFCGAGVRRAGAARKLLALAEAIGWPVVTSPAAKGSFPENHPLGMGIFGLAGNGAARTAIAGARRLLVLGSSLGELATAAWSDKLVAGKDVVQVDLDPAMIGRHYPVTRGYVADVGAVLRQLADAAPRRAWEPPPKAPDLAEGPLPQHLLALAACVPDETCLVSDIGEHMTWALKHWQTRAVDGFDIAINFGGMGSGIAGAIGLKLAQPARPVVCLTGDGCFAMHGSEILTAQQYGLPIAFVVVNNASHGMVHWGHQLQYGRAPSHFTYPRPDLEAVARAYGLPAIRVESPGAWADLDLPALLTGRGPVLIEVPDDSQATPPMADRVRFLTGPLK
ncbi:MAG: acetolactate synthase [Cyanobacteria bacterium RYN_339]|nr:acetolactate synthase [Cyanobacteria bacterium RYN_339]